MMFPGVEHVVIGMQSAAPKAVTGFDHWRPAAVCQDEIESVQRPPHRMVVRPAHLVESRRRIGIPEDLERILASVPEVANHELVVEQPDAARP